MSNIEWILIIITIFLVILLFRYIQLKKQIRNLADQVNELNSGNSQQMLDISLIDKDLERLAGILNQYNIRQRQAVAGVLRNEEYLKEFDRAIVLGIAKKNPSRMIGNIKSKKTKVDFWTLEEFQKVISLLCKKDYYEHYLFISFWLLFMTGMRIGEASALHWSDIDFETGLLSITKTLYYRTMTDYKFVEPKTQASIRTIYIDSDTLNELKAWQSVQQQVLPDCPLVLSYNGTPTSKTTLPRALEKLSNLAGVHRIKIHALRHSHASLLISMGENPLLIKERLGHEKIQTTLGTYGHLYPNTNLEVAKKLTGILQVQSATESIANYTSNQHTAIYHRTVEEK